jgi:hypothetical protein
MTATPTIALRQLADLTPDPDNARTHSDDQVAQIAASIRRFGWTNPMLVDDVIRAGNGRYAAARLMYDAGERIYLAPGEDRGGDVLPIGTVPVIDCTGWDEDERRAYALGDNQIALNAGWDEATLIASLQSLTDTDFDLGAIGFDDGALEAMIAAAQPKEPSRAGNMTAEFLIAPFTVLNAREGWWQDRKRAWLALGIQSELGRGEGAVPDPLGQGGLTDNMAARADGKKTRLTPGGAGGGMWLGGPDEPAFAGDRKKAKATSFDSQATLNAIMGQGNNSEGASPTGTSIFDPVLCELAYRWFSPVGGTVLDPFAGGSVRGIVAAALGRRYVGVDLRGEQIEANRVQWPVVALALGSDAEAPRWETGDSLAVVPTLGVEADFVMTCPPYGDLEVYSDDPADISAMSAAAFDDAYRAIIAASVAALKPDRFACCVVGDYRDKRGIYRNFVSATIDAFQAAGAMLYNEAILITSVGSLPIRAGKQFKAARKLGKTHQNVLVFVKGDPKRATKACGDVDVSGALAAVTPDEDD